MEIILRAFIRSMKRPPATAPACCHCNRLSRRARSSLQRARSRRKRAGWDERRHHVEAGLPARSSEDEMQTSPVTV